MNVILCCGVIFKFHPENLDIAIPCFIIGIVASIGSLIMKKYDKRHGHCKTDKKMFINLAKKMMR
jgi:hypothetical protein